MPTVYQWGFDKVIHQYHLLSHYSIRGQRFKLHTLVITKNTRSEINALCIEHTSMSLNGNEYQQGFKAFCFFFYSIRYLKSLNIDF